MANLIPPPVMYSKIGAVLGTSAFIPGTPTDSWEEAEALITMVLWTTDNLEHLADPLPYESTRQGYAPPHHSVRELALRISILIKLIIYFCRPCGRRDSASGPRHR